VLPICRGEVAVAAINGIAVAVVMMLMSSSSASRAATP
jgi:hypothetical protein